MDINGKRDEEKKSRKGEMTDIMFSHYVLKFCSHC